MFSRMFFAAVGLGAGIAIGVWTIRKIEHAGSQLAPDAVAARAGERMNLINARLSEAIDIGRLAAEAREAELRELYLNGRGGDGDAGR